MTDNVVDFPGPLSRQEAEILSLQNGVVLSINDSETDIKVFGSPTSAELLWLAEQLRIKALFKDENEIDNDDDEIP